MLALSGQAQAAVLDFEGLAPSLFLGADTLGQSGYTFTQNGDFGVVGADFLTAQAPLGNATSFYSVLNDTSVGLTRDDAIGFRLNGFDAGFVTPSPQNGGVIPGRIVLMGSTRSGGSVFGSFEFAPSDANGNFSFEHFASNLSAFTDLSSLTFLACVYSATGSCDNPAENLAQFSLDNVNVIGVPEPSTYALMALGLAAVAGHARRRTHGSN
jgi:hypothetical protein